MRLVHLLFVYTRIYVYVSVIVCRTEYYLSTSLSYACNAQAHAKCIERYLSLYVGWFKMCIYMGGVGLVLECVTFE